MSREVNIKLPSFPLFGVLAVVLTVLNLTGHIDISWWWVVAAFFAPLLLYAGLLSAVAAIGLVSAAVLFLGAFLLDFFNNIHRKLRKHRAGRTRY